MISRQRLPPSRYLVAIASCLVDYVGGATIRQRGLMATIEQRTRVARLMVAPPDMVFAELRAYSQEVQASPYTAASHTLETALATRDDPLIDLGLASYGSSYDVVGGLYRKGKEPQVDDADGTSKQGLRLAVLANETIDAKGFLSRFPENTIGADEVAYVLKEADWTEAETLIRNPTVADDLLQALYQGDGAAAGMDEARRRELIMFTGYNKRLGNEEHYSDGPDMGHYRNHKAIFEMLGKVPTSRRWAECLRYLLDRLVPGKTANPDDITAVLDRWKVNDLGVEDEPENMYYTDTGLPDREELRCLIGALYGKSYKKNIVLHGTADDEDIARRCAFYGNGKLTVEAIKEGLEHDQAVFVLTAMLNDTILQDKKLRKVFEEDCLTGRWNHRYERRLEQIKAEWPHFDTRPIAEWMVDDEKENVRYATQRQVEQLQVNLKEIQKHAVYALWLFSALIAVVAWRN